MITIISILEILMLIIIIGLLVYEYASKNVPLYVKIVCYFS